jgi:hypothetical protein
MVTNIYIMRNIDLALATTNHDQHRS